MLQRILILFFLLIFSKGQAQKVENSFPKWAVTLKPIGIFDPFLTNFTFGVQQYSGGKIISELQLGLIKTWYCSIIQQQDNTSLSGFKVGGEIKYLFFGKMFISAQIFHNNYIESSEELMWRYNRVYTEEMQIDKHVTATGGHFKFGVFWHIPNNRLFFEFYGGVGMRYRTILIEDFPEDAEPVEPVNFFDPDNFTTDLSGSQGYASIALGFAIGYKLSK